jgi:beta-glucosidase/6-phospho-beta-glucosidase/beta-galactosidase
MTQEEYHWFMHHNLATGCVMGNDYYVTNERILQHDGSVQDAGEVLGWYQVTREYYERYRKPIMHTETNRVEEDDAVAWLWKQWLNLRYMREAGIPVIGFTWYSLLHQVDWDTALREPNGNVHAVGLYDLHREIRPVGEAYRELIKEFDSMTIIPHAGFLGIL